MPFSNGDAKLDKTPAPRQIAPISKVSDGLIFFVQTGPAIHLRSFVHALKF
jgi:hypothetical protein